MSDDTIKVCRSDKLSTISVMYDVAVVDDVTAAELDQMVDDGKVMNNRVTKKRAVPDEEMRIYEASIRLQHDVPIATQIRAIKMSEITVHSFVAPEHKKARKALSTSSEDGSDVDSDSESFSAMLLAHIDAAVTAAVGHQMSKVIRPKIVFAGSVEVSPAVAANVGMSVDELKTLIVQAASLNPTVASGTESVAKSMLQRARVDLQFNHFVNIMGGSAYHANEIINQAPLDQDLLTRALAAVIHRCNAPIQDAAIEGLYSQQDFQTASSIVESLANGMSGTAANATFQSQLDRIEKRQNEIMEVVAFFKSQSEQMLKLNSYASQGQPMAAAHQSAKKGDATDKLDYHNDRPEACGDNLKVEPLAASLELPPFLH
jgi:hypothetical protein